MLASIGRRSKIVIPETSRDWHWNARRCGKSGRSYRHTAVAIGHDKEREVWVSLDAIVSARGVARDRWVAFGNAIPVIVLHLLEHGCKAIRDTGKLKSRVSRSTRSPFPHGVRMADVRREPDAACTCRLSGFGQELSSGKSRERIPRGCPAGAFPSARQRAMFHVKQIQWCGVSASRKLERGTMSFHRIDVATYLPPESPRTVSGDAAYL